MAGEINLISHELFDDDFILRICNILLCHIVWLNSEKNAFFETSLFMILVSMITYSDFSVDYFEPKNFF